jgi:hypothetical protein
MDRVFSTYGEKRNACRILLRQPGGKRLLERPRCRWDDNIEMDLRDLCWSGMDWIVLIQDRAQWRTLVNTVVNLRIA